MKLLFIIIILYVKFIVCKNDIDMQYINNRRIDLNINTNVYPNIEKIVMCETIRFDNCSRIDNYVFENNVITFKTNITKYMKATLDIYHASGEFQEKKTIAVKYHSTGDTIVYAPIDYVYFGIAITAAISCLITVGMLLYVRYIKKLDNKIIEENIVY